MRSQALGSRVSSENICEALALLLALEESSSLPATSGVDQFHTGMGQV